MAKGKARGENILFIGKDGEVAIVSGTGEVTVARAMSVLSGDVAALIRRRQAIGKELADALAKAKYSVTGSQEVVVIDPSGALTKLSRKKRKKK